MRSKDVGVIPGVSERFSEQESLEMFEKVCRIRSFETNAARADMDGLMRMPIYLSLGQESIPAAVSTVFKDPLIFGQHRAHGYYIAFGGNLESLIDELLHRETGCAGGMGGSASIHSPEIGMYGHDGLMGSHIPISVGMALGANYGNQKVHDTLGNEITGKKILTVTGDAAAEEDYSIGGGIPWASHRGLPMLFVCEDNNLSILTEVETRRNWKMSDVAQAYGMNAVEMSDDPWSIMHYVKQFQDDLPALMNVYTERAIRHRGGKSADEEPNWNRYELIKEEMDRIGLGNQARDIEQETKEYVDKLWERKREE